MPKQPGVIYDALFYPLARLRLRRSSPQAKLGKQALVYLKDMEW